MVTATTAEDRGSHLLGEATGLLTLRVRSKEHNGRILRIRSPKCVVGSHPSCTLRLRARGVRPFHCLILRGQEGMFIRRWSADTCLNGAGFTDSRLRPGDRLDIGPIELEVLEPSQGDTEQASNGSATRLREDSSAGSSAPLAGPAGPAAAEPNSEPSDGGTALCQQCREDSRELESLLAERVEQGDQDRGKLTQKYIQLVGDLQRVETGRHDPLKEPGKPTGQFQQTAAGYREIIDELRRDLAALKQRHDTQLTEQARLVAQAGEAEERATALATQLNELQQQVEKYRAQDAATSNQQRVQSGEHAQQLATVRSELLQERQNRQTEVVEWESTRRQLNEQLQQLRERLKDATGQIESSRRQAAALETQLEESARQQQASTKTAESAADRMRQYEEELAQLRQELDEQLSQPWQQRQLEWESTQQQLTEQLQQARQQLDDSTSQLEAARQQSATLEADLQQARQQQPQGAEDQERVAALLQQREEELARLQKEFDQQRQQWQQEQERWESDHRQLRETAQELAGREQAAIDKHTTTVGRMTELESLLDEASQKLVQFEEVGKTARQQRDANVSELSKWKDVAESLRLELQQERERHQCVRNEWHADRESLRRELAERSASLEELQASHNQEVQEAEFLIHSLQQEGKQLLSQLDEAKQVIRKDIEKRKKVESQRKGGSAANGALPSRCPTIPMPAQLLGHGRPAEKQMPDDPSSQAQPPAAPEATEHESSRVAQANHTLMMSPAEFSRHLRGDASEEGPPSTAATEGVTASAETPAEAKPSEPEQDYLGTPPAGQEPATDEPTEMQRVKEEPAATASEPDEADAEVAAASEPDEADAEVATPSEPDKASDEVATASESDVADAEPATLSEPDVANAEAGTPDPEATAEETMVLDPENLASSAAAMAADGPAESPVAMSPMTKAWNMLANAPVEPETNDDEEGVIERYMERLLKRVASQGREVVGDPSAEDDHPATETPVDAAPAPMDVPGEQEEASDDDAASSDDDDRSDAADGAPEEGDVAMSLVPRPLTPEMAADLLAMRELANQTARNAIHSSDRRRSLTIACGELLVASVCLVSSCLVIVMSPRTLNSQTIGGAVGAAFGFTMLLRGSYKLLNSLRLQRERPNDAEQACR